MMTNSKDIRKSLLMQLLLSMVLIAMFMILVFLFSERWQVRRGRIEDTMTASPRHMTFTLAKVTEVAAVNLTKEATLQSGKQQLTHVASQTLAVETREAFHKTSTQEVKNLTEIATYWTPTPSPTLTWTPTWTPTLTFTPSSTMTPTPSSTPIAVCETSGRGRIYEITVEWPSFNIASVPGSEVSVLGYLSDRSWYYVSADGQTGWVPSSDMNMQGEGCDLDYAAEMEDPQLVLSEHFQGRRYTWRTQQDADITVSNDYMNLKAADAEIIPTYQDSRIMISPNFFIQFEASIVSGDYASRTGVQVNDANGNFYRISIGSPDCTIRSERYYKGEDDRVQTIYKESTDCWINQPQIISVMREDSNFRVWLGNEELYEIYDDYIDNQTFSIFASNGVGGTNFRSNIEFHRILVWNLQR